jgi:hypothetical protein
MDLDRDSERPGLPLSLRIVAYVTILSGVGSLVDVIMGLFHGHLSLNFGVLQIPAGFGLLRRSQGWRTFELVCLWFAFVAFGIAAIAVASGKTISYGQFPEPWNRHRKELSLLIAGLMLAYLVWEYRVLTSPHVRRLFGLR